jgi:hypothetical protein
MMADKGVCPLMFGCVTHLDILPFELMSSSWFTRFQQVPAHQSAVNDTSPAQADSATPMVWMSEQIREHVQAELAAHLPTPPPSNVSSP